MPYFAEALLTVQLYSFYWDEKDAKELEWHTRGFDADTRNTAMSSIRRGPLVVFRLLRDRSDLLMRSFELAG
jgi:hypothetical protein